MEVARGSILIYDCKILENVKGQQISLEEVSARLESGEKIIEAFKPQSIENNTATFHIIIPTDLPLSEDTHGEFKLVFESSYMGTKLFKPENLLVFKRLIRMPYDPSKVSDEVLLDDHRLVHAWWALLKSGKLHKYSEEDLINLHKLIFEEMRKRGFEHHMTDALDDQARVPELPPTQKLAPILPGGTKPPQKEIALDIVKAFKPFKIRQDYVVLVGSLANWEKTKGDIDLLLRAKASDSIVRPTIFRIGRQFPSEISRRFSFHLDENFGPFTDHVVIYDLWAIPRETKPVIQMALPTAEKAKEANKISLGEFFYPLKGVIGYKEGEVYSILKLPAFISSYPVQIEKKYDGARLQLHRSDTIRIFTDGGIEVSKRLPGIYKEALKLLPVGTIIDSETEGWLHEKHIGREELAGYLNRNDPPDDRNIIMNVFDILMYEGKDLHELPLSERLKYLDKIEFSQSTTSIPDVHKTHFNRSVALIVNTPSELPKAIEMMKSARASEGALIKELSSNYPLTGNTSRWVKFKTMLEVTVAVVSRLTTRTPNVYNYWIGIRPGSMKPPPKKLVDIKGTSYMVVGKTFNTKHRLEPGQRLSVYVHTVFRWIGESTEYLTFYEPRVLGPRPDAQDAGFATNVLDAALDLNILVTKKYGGELVDWSKEEMQDGLIEFYR